MKNNFSQLAPKLSALALPLVMLSACGGTDETDVDAHPCSAEKHCVRDNGESFCEDNYNWEDASDHDNYNCLPKTMVLGGFSHSLDDVDLRVISRGTENLNQPRDVAINPNAKDQLWVVNAASNSVSILFDPGTGTQSSAHFYSFGADHFMAHPAAMAFGENGMWSSAQEEDDLTQGPNGTPADFMGPSLWSDDLSFFDAGHGSHMDMLHNSPNSTGIAWESGNAYWVHDGAHRSISRYDFNRDHGPGGPDHSDGEMSRYVEGEVSYVPEVSSHMELDHDTDLLFISDTGANRIAVLDITTGTTGARVFPNYDGGNQVKVDGAELSTHINGNDIEGMELPSGLELHDGLMYISDNQTSMIFAFDMEGTLVDYLDTGLPAGSIQGMSFGADGSLFFADTAGNAIWQLSAK